MFSGFYPPPPPASMPKHTLPTKRPLEYSYGERFALENQKGSSMLVSKFLLISCLALISILTIITLI